MAKYERNTVTVGKECQVVARYRFSKLMLAGTVLAQLSLSAVASPPAQAFTNQTLVHGSQGYNVDELQSRLGFLGYYHHKVDGIFGWSTYWAVRDFQYAFGMNPTGVVDMATKIMLVNATKTWHYEPIVSLASGSSSTSGPSGSTGSGGSLPTVTGAMGSNSSGNPGTTGGTNPGSTGSTASGTTGTTNPGSTTGNNSPQPPGGQPGGQAAASVSTTPTAPIGGVSPTDQTLLAHVVYAEARGEPFIGQVAVAAVVLNRLRSPKFPKSIPAIIYQPQAFTSVQDGQINLTPNAEAYKAVADALSGWDPADGATYYFNPATATSPWIWSKPEILQIGHHIFCR